MMNSELSAALETIQPELLTVLRLFGLPENTLDTVPYTAAEEAGDYVGGCGKGEGQAHGLLPGGTLGGIFFHHGYVLLLCNAFKVLHSFDRLEGFRFVFLLLLPLLTSTK